MADIIEDFPSGPLDFYRNKASVDWKKLKLTLYTEDEIRYLVRFHLEFKLF